MAGELKINAGIWPLDTSDPLLSLDDFANVTVIPAHEILGIPSI